MGGGPGCLGAVPTTIAGGVIAALSLGLEGATPWLILVGMMWTWAAASAISATIFERRTGADELTPLTEATGALLGILPWLGLWLVAERISRDAAFGALAVTDGLYVLAVAVAFGWAFLRFRRPEQRTEGPESAESSTGPPPCPQCGTQRIAGQQLCPGCGLDLWADYDARQ